MTCAKAIPGSPVRRITASIYIDKSPSQGVGGCVARTVVQSTLWRCQFKVSWTFSYCDLCSVFLSSFLLIQIASPCKNGKQQRNSPIPLLSNGVTSPGSWNDCCIWNSYYCYTTIDPAIKKKGIQLTLNWCQIASPWKKGVAICPTVIRWCHRGCNLSFGLPLSRSEQRF